MKFFGSVVSLKNSTMTSYVAVSAFYHEVPMSFVKYFDVIYRKK